MSRLLSGLTLLLMLSGAAAQGVYRWVDDNGVTHFGDAPQAPRAERIQLEDLSTVGSPQSSEISTPSQPTIIMYGATWCGFCKAAKTYFKKNKIKYTEYDVEKSSKGRAAYKKMKSKSVPQFLINGARIQGFSQKEFDKILGLGQG